MRNEKKKQLLLIVVICGGMLLTAFSSFWFYSTVVQKDILYKDVPFQRGMSFTNWGAYSFNSTQAKNEILEMKEIGIEWVAANIWWFQESVSTSKIFEADWSDSAENITAFFDYVHDQDMKVLFKPMLDPLDGNWRSNIEAKPEWMKAYAKFIRYAAEIAENASVEVLSIGCEMGNWQMHEKEVLDLIEDVRDIYSGLLTYAANHDSFWYVNFWDKIDIIGIDAYFPFTLSYDPTLDDMIEVWDAFYDDLNKFQRKWNKPVMFTELGCQNRDGCNIMPNDVKFNQNQDEDEFKMFYKSLFESKVWTAPWFKGTYWWIWDLREIDELEEIGFTPQLPIIQSTLHKYYSEKRNIAYPSYWIEFLLIIALGCSITVAMGYLVYKFDFEGKEKDQYNSEPLDENREDEKNPLFRFTLTGGITFGLFLFWAFSYYNQILFNVLYSAVTKTVFLGEGVLIILMGILIALVLMAIVWIVLQRLLSKRYKKVPLFVSIISVIVAVLVIIMEGFFTNTLSNELSINFFLTLQVMIILAVIFTTIMTYGFPHRLIKTLEKEEKTRLIFKISLSIIAIAAIMLVSLSYFLQIYARGPSLVVALVSVALIPLITKVLKSHEVSRGEDRLNEPKLSLKEKLRFTQGKFTEALLCLFTLGYYFGVLRYYDIHTLINFNLILLPNFFIPVGFSILIAIPLLIGLNVLMQWKNDKIKEKFNFENRSRGDVIISMFELAIFFSLVVLFAGWFFSAASFEIALILGGIPLVLILLIYLVGLTKSQEIFKDKSSWKRLTIYLVITLTIAFSANGITVGLIYALTFLYVEEGKVVVRTQFEEKLGYDAIQMIYNIQLLVAIIPIVICLILLKFVVLKINKTKNIKKSN